MMTISESQFSSNKMSSIHKINDRIVHRDSFDDTKSSSSVNSTLITKRGFKPSDMYDPQKKEFLTNLSYKLFPVSWNDADLSREPALQEPLDSLTEDMENKPVLVGEKEVDLNKIFTPAPDAEEHIIKKDRKFEKTFASSAFYVPGVHPTVKEQMDLARAISKSLSDSSNHMSRGQSMYVNRKKRSVKWVHEGRGRNTSNACSTPTPVANHDTPYRPPSSLRNQKTYPKSALKHSSNLPKMEPFPISPPTITVQNIDVPVPMAPTKLNDVYASPKSPRLPLVSGPNFNVAPRGWGEMKDYYRPVVLDGAGASTHYTDF
ncbi:uncharacterized protein LOC124642653 isoform X1 [Helicoverpa zea]|uniref:uncharacterized protein LOC124642653 isoform X1 n=1 Tax=Helicoverpa zea TaxID=7113 RepID=UPI001F586FE3|nr:uncharacterized protein LOC124642653 isoform X1 [Helicoverpa zea]XP_047037170.1 uncharacterized protein LOC124642653 isoform X1 [Helicoverpa zea]XP_047037172.1 uncharacterized protein LOC124642653 isoform X1 [Helicoverpa zea]XP_047037173.1 uncharacterized protein LOC124642653 isoform X1 [Helicoverpa zea]XP_047037174.1 uncharacterized protein LOC124642653 isoform X1 [Helicoverpa zea]XP_047037175.1 uncharacterized protein LOC124642653 isoform X1 [Helicoverpa zea]XP_047037176.1 uncharacterize